MKLDFKMKNPQFKPGSAISSTGFCWVLHKGSNWPCCINSTWIARFKAAIIIWSEEHVVCSWLILTELILCHLC